MAAILKLCSVLFILSTIDQGWAYCTLADIAVNQTKVSSVGEGYTQYEVVVSNNCICSQTDVLLQCNGFNTLENMNPLIFTNANGGNCLVNNGMPIFEGYPIKFNYTWITPHDLPPARSQVNCS